MARPTVTIARIFPKREWLQRATRADFFMHASRLISITFVCCALVGCKPKNTETPEEPLAKPVEVEPEPEPEAAEVQIDQAVADLCDMPTAHFSFNSTKLDGGAKDALDSLATCFISGPASSKSVRLVGHADPRGDEEYNFGLGQRRAGSVGKYLEQKGLGSDRIETSSRGELDASGSDESGWASDRKVAIYFGN